jgi:hypothetical protein
MMRTMLLREEAVWLSFCRQCLVRGKAFVTEDGSEILIDIFSDDDCSCSCNYSLW